MLKILIVEDDMLIAMELTERVAEMGHVVIGPAYSIPEAEALIAKEWPDAALLDANLAGVSSVPLGVLLTSKGVPIAFCTGYDKVQGVTPELASAKVLTKPVSDADLRAAIATLLA